jgi:hypothetical protein
MSVIVELLCGAGERKTRKRERSISNTIKHYICEGTGYNDIHWKLLKNGGWEVKG